jgi:hypothetical protein
MSRIWHPYRSITCSASTLQEKRRLGGVLLDEELPAGSNLILLQCRPETVWSNAVRKPAFGAGAGMMSWITGSISGATAVPAQAHDASHQH